MKIRGLVVLLLLLSVLPTHATDKPKLTLDEFFNFVGFTDVKISPDGRAVVIGTLRADWDQSIFRKDLWLYRDDASGNGTLTQLTQSGHDAPPQWSPDGRWIAFLSEVNRTHRNRIRLGQALRIFLCQFRQRPAINRGRWHVQH